MSNSIQVEFDNPEKTIIRWDFRGRWTWDAWYKSADRTLELRREVLDLPVVAAILNFERSGPVPMGLLPHARTAMEMVYPNDFIVIAGGSGYLRSLAQTFRLLNPSLRDKVLLAESVEQARQIIAERLAK